MLYFILRYIIRYRISVVRNNIRNSFPDKTDYERECIVNNFYRFMAQLFYESVCTLFISEKKIKQRFRFVNPEIFQQIAEEGQSAVYLFGHYGNWEWMGSFPLWVKQYKVGAIYSRLLNDTFDRIYHKIRSRFGVHCIEKKQTLRELVKWNAEKKPFILGVLADQSPASYDINIHLWLKFLNQPTAVISGWASIARKMNCAVGYLDVKVPKRGYYEIHCEIITRDPKSYSEEELVKEYMSRLEKTINSNPQYWLWSHRRWKHVPPADIE